MAAATWVLPLLDAANVKLGDLDEVTGTFRFECNQPAKFTPKFDETVQAAADIQEALTSCLPWLLGFRQTRPDGASSPRSDLRFAGIWAPQQEDVDDTTSEVQAEFRSALEAFRARYVSGGPYSADAGAVIHTTLNNANAAGATRLVFGSAATTFTVHTTYDHKPVGDALDELTGADPGLDLVETPLDPRTNSGALGQLDVVASQGVDRTETARFEFGEGTLANCVSASRTIGRPVNAVTVTGATGVTPQTATDSASIATYDRWEALASLPDVTDTGLLLAHAQALLVPQPVVVHQFEPDPVAGPQPWTDYWLGDTCAFLARQDAFTVAGSARVNAIEIDIDEQGTESAHRVEWGDQRVVPIRDVYLSLRQLPGLVRRVGALERL